LVLILPILFQAWKKKRKIWALFNYGLITSSGLVLFVVYLYLKLGKLAPFLGVMKAWHYSWTPPWISLNLFWESILTIPTNSPFFAVAVFDLITVLLFTILLIISFRKIGFVYQLFIWPIYLFSMSKSWNPSFFLPSGSISRHLFQMFPLVILLARIGRKNELFHYLIIFFFASLFGPLALAFFHGFWVQ